MDLRKQFVDNLIELTETNKDIILLTGDLGFNFLERFAEKFPDQYINCGAIEGSMVGIAGGLALAGKKPFVYTGTIFLLRAYEQIRNLCYNNLNVKLCGTSASGFLGFSHNFMGPENIEDLFKNLPYLRIYPRGDKEELLKAMKSDKISLIQL